MFAPQCRFLVVDDMSAMQLVMKAKLKELGFLNVTTAASPNDAMALIEKGFAEGNAMPFDVIISDYMMPGMTGVEFVQKLRADPKYSKVPFLLVTAEADGNSIETAVKAGIDGFLQKPPSKDKLEQLFKSTAQLLSQQGRAPALA